MRAKIGYHYRLFNNDKLEKHINKRGFMLKLRNIRWTMIETDYRRPLFSDKR